MNDAAITVRYTDGTERTVTVNRGGDGTLHVPVEDGVAHFGRDDGEGWREFFAVPLVNIRDWGYPPVLRHQAGTTEEQQ